MFSKGAVLVIWPCELWVVESWVFGKKNMVSIYLRILPPENLSENRIICSDTYLLEIMVGSSGSSI